MTRPFSEAQTTLMPELHHTQPIAIGLCGWCDIKLTAIPDPPRFWGDRYYHPGGCVAAARGQQRGESTDLSAMIGETEGAAAG